MATIPGENPVALMQSALEASGTAALEAAVARLAPRQGNQPFVLFGQAELASRKGERTAALNFSTTAVSAMFQHKLLSPAGSLELMTVLDAVLGFNPATLRNAYAYFRQWGGLLEEIGTVHALGPRLQELASRLSSLSPAVTPLHVEAVFALLGFHRGASRDWVETVFTRLVQPWMIEAARRGDVAAAMHIEHFAYDTYVLQEEGSTWFTAATSRWVPALAEAVRAGRPAEVHGQWTPRHPRRVAFFLHRASSLAHVQVMAAALKAAHDAGSRGYEFTVFVLRGREAWLHDALTAAGVKVRYLEEGNPERAARLRLLEEELLRDNFAAVFWVSLVPMMALSFPRRVAPLQGWWSMKYHALELPEIDVRLGMESVVTRKSMGGHEWRTFGTAMDSWVTPGLGQAARELRAEYPADAIVAASIGREEKIDSPAFLAAICELLRREPKMVFLWTGRRQLASIQSAFESAGVSARTHFVGWVDTRLYAQAIDLFLDSFPFPCGFTLKEAMAAGKPAVMMRTDESLETGVPGAISPLIDGSGRAPEEARRDLRAIFTGQADFDLYCCARDPAGYVDLAQRLVTDARLRERTGAANRAFIERFLCSPVDEGRKFLDHLDELFATTPALGGTAA